MILKLTVYMFVACVTIVPGAIHAQGAEQHGETLSLRPDLLALLQAEMREISSGVQNIPVAIAEGDWRKLIQTSESIQSSYIMAKALTRDQAEALEAALPDRFKQIDSDFHARAGKLARAAESRDFELASYHYSRLIEACAQCHSLYASDRFPAFGPARADEHHH